MGLCYPELVTSQAGYLAGVNQQHPTGFYGALLICSSRGSGPEIAGIEDQHL